MKVGVPVLNILVSLLYLTISAIVIYCVKLVHNKYTDIQQQDQSKSRQLLSKTQINYTKLIAKSWFRKYSLIGVCVNNDKKYLVKELFIMSVYAVTCLKINKIIVWPVSFICFLLPTVLIICQFLIQKIRKYKSEQAKTINKINLENIEIEPVLVEDQNIAILQPIQSHRSITNKNDKKLGQILIIASFSFMTFVLLLQTVFILTNSISNSGELNILSLLVILTIDQLLVRSATGLITLGLIKLLAAFGKINLQQNVLINYLCREQIVLSILQAQKQIVKGYQQKISSHHLNQINRQKSQDISKPCLNLINLNAQTKMVQQEYQLENDPLEQEIYLTTPEKQLFQHGDQESLQQNKSILHSIINNKENDLGIHQLNKSTLKSCEISKGDDLITIKDDSRKGDTQNVHGQFILQNSNYGYRKKGNGRKKAKRELKLTGSSPYLEYLPNMLKKVDKYKQTHNKSHKML